MTKNEKKQVTLQLSWLLFQFLNKRDADVEIFGKWTRKDFKKDIKEVVEEVAEEFGIMPAKPVIGCNPQKGTLWFSLYAIDGDEKADASLTRHISWEEFEHTIMDHDLEELEWLEARFRSLANKLKRYIEE